NMVDAAAGVGELRQVEQVDWGDLGLRPQSCECVAVARKRADLGSGSKQLAGDDAAELTRRTRDEDARIGHTASTPGRRLHVIAAAPLLSPTGMKKRMF